MRIMEDIGSATDTTHLDSGTQWILVPLHTGTSESQPNFLGCLYWISWYPLNNESQEV